MPRKTLYRTLPVLVVVLAATAAIAQVPAEHHTKTHHESRSNDTNRSNDIRHHLHGIAQSAPDWMVWLAFHRSLNFYSEQSPNLVIDLVTSRLGVAPEVAIDELNRGNGYADSLARIEAELARDLRPQSGGTPSSADIQAAIAEAKSRDRSAQRPNWARTIAAAEKVPPTPLLGARIDPDILTKFSDARTQVLQRHMQSLSALVGDDAFARLIGWIEKEVRPNVRVAHMESEIHSH